MSRKILTPTEKLNLLFQKNGGVAVKEMYHLRLGVPPKTGNKIVLELALYKFFGKRRERT